MQQIQEAASLFESGKADEAVKLLQKAIKQASDDEVFAISDVYYQWGYYEQAAKLLESLLEKYQGEGEIITQLAEIYIELEDDERAIDLLNDVKKEDEFYIESLLNLADLYQSQGLFEVSEEKLLEAKRLAPNEIVIDFALAEFLFSIGQANRAIPFYEKVSKELDDINGVSVEERLAESHATIGHSKEALAYYEVLESNNPDTLFKHGFTAFQQHENEIAIRIWKKLLEIDPYYYTVYPELASAMKEVGQLNEAYLVAKKGISYDEFNKELFFIAAQLALTLNEEKQAFDYLKQAVTLDYDYKEAVLLLIEWYKQKGNDEAIVELITTIKEKGASDPLYDWEIARAFVELEQFDSADDSYIEASENLMHDSEFLKEYGFFLSEEGKIQQSVSILEKYLQLEPMDNDTKEFVERLIDSNSL